MATGKVIGQIEVTKGSIKIVGVDGVVREPGYGGFVYENEQVVSNDPDALFQIKFLALPESSAYDGIFRILADGSVIHGRDTMDSIASDENLVDILETAAGEESADGSSGFTETDIVADSSVLGFSRGANGELGFGITDFGGENVVYDLVQDEGAAPVITPPAITSPNVVIYDEHGSEPVIQVEANGESSVSYSIAGLDSENFTIDPQTGVLTFNESPDFEDPKDLGGDNEYNIYVTATDEAGNYTTQLLSVSINNVNEPVTAVDDTVNAVEDAVLSSTIDLDANDYDIDGDDLSVIPGTFATTAGGEIVIATDGSYTYTPPTNFNGSDSVGYIVTDGEFSDVGILTINVEPVNDAPVASDDSAQTQEDTAITLTAADVLGNDEDVDGNILTITEVSNPLNGTVVLNENGTITFTPADDYHGSDASFDYTITDGNGETSTATVNVDVTSVNDAPYTDNVSASGAEDATSIAITLTGNDDDDNGTVESFQLQGLPQNGTLYIDVGLTIAAITDTDYAATDEALTLYFVPNADWNGETTFNYAAIDSNGLADATSATATINVTPVADAPVVIVDADVENPIISSYGEKIVISEKDSNINNGSDTGILKFDGYARSVSVSIKSFNGKEGKDTGTVELLRDGDVIKTYSLNDYFTGGPSESVDDVLTFTSATYFNEVRVSNTSTNNQFKVEYVELVSPYLITYNIEADAYLGDTDSSEILSNLILKVPSFLDGILIVDGVASDAVLSADGNYNYYSIPATDTDVKLIFDHAISQEWESAIDSISGNATSWESEDGFAPPVTDNGDIIAGTTEDNEIYGEDGDDIIFGGDGVDTLYGGDGDDTIAGEVGDDYIDGGAGADAIYGGAGDDTITGGGGNDYINGGGGSDTIYGGAGDDTIEYDALDTVIDGGTGFDTLIGNAETINLSNLSGIEVIQLNIGTTVEGSTTFGINADDVISATGDDNTLYINSLDGDASGQVSVDTSSLFEIGSIEIDGINYAQYTDGDATLLIQIEDIGVPL